LTILDESSTVGVKSASSHSSLYFSVASPGPERQSRRSTSWTTSRRCLEAARPLRR